DAPDVRADEDRPGRRTGGGVLAYLPAAVVGPHDSARGVHLRRLREDRRAAADPHRRPRRVLQRRAGSGRVPRATEWRAGHPARSWPLHPTRRDRHHDRVLRTSPGQLSETVGRTRGMIVPMATPIGPEARPPNPALEPLAPLIGRWRTTGTHPLVPGTTFHGRTSFEWHEHGAFLLMRSEIDEPEIPSAVAILGSDDAAGTFTMIYFDERDISRHYSVEVTDGGLSWHRNEAGFAQRMVLTIGANGDRLDARGTMS